MKTYSLRRATLGALALPLVSAVAVAMVAALWFSDRAIGLLRDDQVRQEAAFLLLLARHEATEGEELGMISTVESADLRRVLGDGTSFRIWSGDTLVTYSQQPAGTLLPRAPIGFSHHLKGGVDYRTYAVREPGTDIVIEVSEPMQTRKAMTGQVVASLAIPLGFVLLAVSAIAYAQISAAMRPMLRISAELDARRPDDMRPLSGHRIPQEIAPLFSAFNRLLARLGAAVTREREFADNAAHELRTPLAVLKTRAQIVARDAAEGAHKTHVEQLVRATDRATGVIDQLLQLNRSGGGGGDAVNLSDIATSVCRLHAPAALQRNQDFGADIAPDIWVAGQADALAMVVRNLVDNAIRHTPEGSHIDISLFDTPNGKVGLRVCDTGPGIPADRREAAFDRFQRLGSDKPGSGLGLAIVNRIIAQHDGSISLADNWPQGLCVGISLPKRAPPPAGS
jgi:signal transduction histidine kinase